MKDFIIVIPARYNSKRLPGKPLIKINGIPMLLRTYYQCKKVVSESKIVIATDDQRIQKLCKKHNIQSVMTSRKCLTGTDRIYELSKKIKKDFYINVQGDEPICNPEDIKKIISFAKKHPYEVINGYTEIRDKNSFYSQNIPKVIFDYKKNLIYMSRAPIPSNKKKLFIKGWRQVCIYSFPFRSLRNFALNKKKTLLESIEDLESNRFIELGYRVKMLKMSDKSIAVDTKDDLKKVAKLLKK